jgi:hypothetical protein
MRSPLELIDSRRYLAPSTSFVGFVGFVGEEVEEKVRAAGAAPKVE